MESVWIGRDLYETIRKNPDCFGSFIRIYFGFEEKKLNHWKIVIEHQDSESIRLDLEYYRDIKIDQILK